jgi:excisionase family DNA binding protein
MEGQLYSVEQVAERLGLHVRTVRGYVRDGRLPAVRIGKQYRIAQEDLEEFTGRPVSPPPGKTAGRHRRTEVSSIVEIDAVGPDTAHRISTLLMAGAAHYRGDDGEPLRVKTAYEEERAHMKIIVLGGLADSARVLDQIEAVLTS